MMNNGRQTGSLAIISCEGALSYNFSLSNDAFMRNSHSDVKYNGTIACMHPIERWIVFQVMHAWASFFLALEKLYIWGTCVYLYRITCFYTCVTCLAIVYSVDRSLA